MEPFERCGPGWVPEELPSAHFRATSLVHASGHMARRIVRQCNRRLMSGDKYPACLLSLGSFDGGYMRQGTLGLLVRVVLDEHITMTLSIGSIPLSGE